MTKSDVLSLIDAACAPLRARIAEIERQLEGLGDRAGIPVRLTHCSRRDPSLCVHPGCLISGKCYAEQTPDRIL